MHLYKYTKYISFDKFVYQCLRKILPKNEIFSFQDLKGLVNKNFDNVLKIGSYEILIEQDIENPRYYKFTINEIPKAENIQLNFGCELETCLILDCDYKNPDEEVKNLLKKIENISETKNKKAEWVQLVKYHLRKNLIPNLSKEFINRFPYAFIVSIKNAKSGVLIDLLSGETVNERYKLDNYKTLFFIPDSSIKCKENKEDERLLLPCEIVTPILNTMNELNILLTGLVSGKCNLSNSSTGYHVNVSATNLATNTLLPLSRIFSTVLVEEWTNYESNNYYRHRGEGTVYAKNIHKKIHSESLSNLLDYIISKNNGERINNVESSDNMYNLDFWFAVKTFLTQKYLSMTGHKGNDVVEFRIFPSKNDINLLLEYTQEGITVFEKAVKNYIDNSTEIALKLQTGYLNYKYNFKTPFTEYHGHREELHLLYNYILQPKLIYKIEGSKLVVLDSAESTESYIICDYIDYKTYKIKYYRYKITKNDETDYYDIYDRKSMTESDYSKLLRLTN